MHAMRFHAFQRVPFVPLVPWVPFVPCVPCVPFVTCVPFVKCVPRVQCIPCVPFVQCVPRVQCIPCRSCVQVVLHISCIPCVPVAGVISGCRHAFLLCPLWPHRIHLCTCRGSSPVDGILTICRQPTLGTFRGGKISKSAKSSLCLHSCRWPTGYIGSA